MTDIPINFVTTDFSRWGAGLNRLLAATEIDRNFWELVRAVTDLIANPPEPIQIASFNTTSSGVGMTITMSNGSVAGPLPLPVLVWRYRGAWLPSVPYAVLDVFKVEGIGIFLVLQDHTSDLTFDPDALLLGNPIYQSILAINAPTRASGISATGSTQSDALPLTADWSVIYAVTAGQGVALRGAAATGFPQWVFNRGTNPLLVYPKNGDSAAINTQAANAPFTIEPDSGVEFRPYSATQWYSAT